MMYVMNVLNNENLTEKSVRYIVCICVICLIAAYLYPLNIHRIASVEAFKPMKYPRLNNKKNCTIGTEGNTGRLGNMLFMFASAYGLSLEHSCHLYVAPKVMNAITEYFETNLTDLLNDSEVNRRSPLAVVYNFYDYLPNVLQRNTPQHIMLTGFWQAEKQFPNQRHQIREILRFKSTVLDTVKSFLRTTIKNPTVNVVGVHIRRGDFIGLRRTSSDEFVFNAMTYFTRKLNFTNFLIVSDDKPHVQNVFGKRSNIFFTPDSFNPGEDMAVLALCNHVIITVGTFGWWAGYLLQDITGEVLTDSTPNHCPYDAPGTDGTIFFPPSFKFLN